MVNVMLPKQINPIQLADNQSTLKGELLLSEMERLIELIYDKSAFATINLTFGRDQQGYVLIRGSIKTELKILCQRCNNQMSLILNVTVKASPVRTDDEIARLPKNYDPLLLTDDTISLVTMVEEEILLSMPIVPRHLKKECRVKSSQFAEMQEQKSNKPFKVLKKLLRE